MSPRIILLTGFGLLFAAASSKLVGLQGESHRRALAEEWIAVAKPTQAPPPEAREKAEPPVVVATAPPVEPKPTPAPTPTPMPMPTAETPPVVVKPSEPSSKRTEPAAPLAPGEALAKSDPFWGAPAMRKSWDLSRPSLELETALGAALNGVVMKFNQLVVAGPWLERVENAAEPLIKSLPDPKAKYRFTILASNDVNAFSHPGRYVYLSRAVFDMIAEDQEYALTFLIAHEMAHVELKHGMQCLSHPAMKKTGLGTAAQYYLLILPAGYAEAQDQEADRWAYRKMRELGYTRRETLTCLWKLRDLAKLRGFENVRAEPKPGSDASLVEKHLWAHPLVRQRLKALTELEPVDAPARP